MLNRNICIKQLKLKGLPETLVFQIQNSLFIPKYRYVSLYFNLYRNADISIWNTGVEFLTVGEIISEQKRSKKSSVGLLYLCQSIKIQSLEPNYMGSIILL